MSRPNILFLHSHNTGRYVEPYGHAVPTPNLMRLAREGVMFRNCFAAAPTCSPSRASFLTGMCPHSAGMLGLAHRGFNMTDYARHIANVMKRAGYLTALAGVEHTATNLADVGYDRILSAHDTNYPDQEARPIAESAVAFLESAGNTPFFLSVGLNETHRPFPAPDPAHHPAEDPRYCMPPRPLPDTPETRADIAAFKHAARDMDDAFGKVLAALDRTGLAANTLVFCFSDHGLQFPRNMCNLTDHGLAVYCILRGPGGFIGGKVIEELVTLIDLVPTAYAAAGIAMPDWVEGKPLAPLVRGEAPSLRDELFGECNYHSAYEPMRSVRTTRFKYIRRFYPQRDRAVFANIDPQSVSTRMLREKDWDQQPYEQEMLFDLVFDPDEMHNVVNEPRFASVRADLSARLDAWMRQTNDPLLPTGVVPQPTGTIVNDPDTTGYRSVKATKH